MLDALYVVVLFKSMVPALPSRTRTREGEADPRDTGLHLLTARRLFDFGSNVRVSQRQTRWDSFPSIPITNALGCYTKNKTSDTPQICVRGAVLI